jgi:cation transporter-like permease
MATAHGAGLMLLPVFLGTTRHDRAHDARFGHAAHAGHGADLDLLNNPWLATVAVIVHTLAHLMVAGLVAMIVYEKLGVRILQRAWFNFDLAWAIALIVTGFVTLFL